MFELARSQLETVKAALHLLNGWLLSHLLKIILKILVYVQWKKEHS